MKANLMSAPKLRVARPTDNIEKLKPFYIDGLGLRLLSEFSDHDGFSGVMIGAPDATYHFEFTHCAGHIAGSAPTQDNLIVFYLPDETAWTRAVMRMQQVGYDPVQSFNLYWDRLGRTFEDADGYRVVLQNAEWG